MNAVGYNLIAAASVVCGTALGVTALITGGSPVDVVAVTAPFLGLAGTIAGRGSKGDDE